MPFFVSDVLMCRRTLYANRWAHENLTDGTAKANVGAIPVLFHFLSSRVKRINITEYKKTKKKKTPSGQCGFGLSVSLLVIRSVLFIFLFLVF